MQQGHEFVHEAMFRPILRRAQCLSIYRSAPAPAFEQVETIIHFQPPCAAVDPGAQLPATAQFMVNERRQNIINGVLIAEANPGAAADELLPEGAGPRCGGIYL